MKMYRNSANMFDKSQEATEIYVTPDATRYGYVIPLSINNTYTLSNGSSIVFCKIRTGDNYGIAADTTSPRTYSINNPNSSLLIYSSNISAFENVNLMLNIGENALPYEPYNVIDWYTTGYSKCTNNAWSAAIADKKRTSGEWV